MSITLLATSPVILIKGVGVDIALAVSEASAVSDPTVTSTVVAVELVDTVIEPSVGVDEKSAPKVGWGVDVVILSYFPEVVSDAVIESDTVDDVDCTVEDNSGTALDVLWPDDMTVNDVVSNDGGSGDAATPLDDDISSVANGDTVSDIQGDSDSGDDDVTPDVEDETKANGVADCDCDSDGDNDPDGGD